MPLGGMTVSLLDDRRALGAKVGNAAALIERVKALRPDYEAAVRNELAAAKKPHDATNHTIKHPMDRNGCAFLMQSS